MKRTSLVYEFVEFIPSDPQEGTLYISVPYATGVHLCACGCGIKVVTPISPPEWHLLWDGDTVSLRPSIGNWQFPCRSHYWITRNQVRWARALTDEEIMEGRRRDAEELADYFARERTDDSDFHATPSTEPRESIVHRLRRLLRLH